MWSAWVALLVGPVPATLPGMEAAWALTEGSPRVIVAVLSDGEDLRDPELASRLVLNADELARGGPVDRNGDGVLTVLDWVRSSTQPSFDLDAIVDPLLRARDDRGDANDNGRLDPQDLALIYADGVDDDDNGWVDDIAGWDLLELDADPSPAPDAFPSAARVVSEACPRCSILPLRVSIRGLADAGLVAVALKAAADRGAAVVLIDLAVPGLTPDLLSAAEQIDLPIVAEAGTAPFASHLADIRLADPRFVLVSASGAGDCAKQPLPPDVLAPGGRCPHPQRGAAVAGLLGLMVEANQRGTREAPAPVPAARASELTLALRRSTPFRSLVDPAAAVRAVASAGGVPAAIWREPRDGAVRDPTTGFLRISAGLEGPARAYGVALGGPGVASDRPGVGLGPPGVPLETVVEGVIAPNAKTLEIEVPIGGRSVDPAATGSPEAKAFLLRLTIRGGPDGDFVETRRIFLDADLDRLPAFPLELGAGVAGSPRILDPDGSGPAIWVPMLDGRLLRVEGRGQIAEALPARFRSVSGPLPWPRLSAPTLQPDRSGVGSVAADGQVEVWDPGGPRALGAGFALGPLRPAGSLFPAVASESALAWSDPLGLWVGDTRVGSLLVAAGPLAFDGEEFWGISRGVLEARGGTRLALPPGPPTAGLSMLPGRGPIVTSVRGRPGLRVVVAGERGLSVVDGARVEAETIDAEAPLVSAALSAAGDQVLAWRRGATGRLEAVALPDGEVREAPWDGVGAELLVADVDGGSAEWIGAGIDALHAVSANGLAAAGWPKITGEPLLGVPVFGDLDGDQNLEIAAVTRGGRLFVWRTRGRSEGLRWGQRRHDAYATGDVRRGSSTSSPGAGCRCHARALRSSRLWGWGLWGWVFALRRLGRSARGPQTLP